jgi:DNA-binding CsgD family transcriptional regulator
MGAAGSETVRVDELRRVLRLALDLRDLPAGSEAQRRHALEGLCALVGAQVGLWVDVDGMRTGRIIIRDGLDHGFPDERGRRLFSRHVREAQWTAPDPSMPGLSRLARGPFSTFLREDLVPNREWYRSAHVQEIRREAAVDSFIYTAHLPDADTALCFSLHRPWCDRPFGARESAVVDAFHRECSFVHRPPRSPEAERVRALPPRLRETLAHLAWGLSEKQIAEKLAISQHTVHDYVKELHRRFGVQSRGELLARGLG